MTDSAEISNPNSTPKIEELNPQQQQAVLYFDSPLLIIAGAGSGKTKVITNKIAHLINNEGYSPHHILGVTFTNKAAEEMKSRIRNLTGIEAKNFNIFTFHALGLRILRESGASAGFDSQWMVMDDQDQRKIFEKIIKDNFSYFTSDNRDEVRRKVGFAKMELHYPNNKEFLYQIGFNEDEVKIYSLYYQYQKEKKLWDYEDLVSFPVILLRNNENLKTKYANRYKYVVGDEFQDTNPNQYELLTAIAGKHQNITVVGDDDQAVYSWRGASIRFLFHFEHDFPGTKIVKLEQNYRSTPQVLDFANRLISQNTVRRVKTMWTDEKSGNPVYLLETRSKEDEARQIADLIVQVKDTKPELFPLAVLYRINSQSLAFETEFTRRQINFKILKGLRFFDRKEVKDSLALLKLTVNPDDDISFFRVVDFLPLGIGSKTLDTLAELSARNSISAFQALRQHLPDKFNSREIFPAFFKLNREIGGDDTNLGEEKKIKLSEALKRILHISGYYGMLKEKEDQSRFLNVEELITFIETWENSNPGESIAQLMDFISIEAGSEKETDNTQVFLLTMHNAKGLEFPTAVVAGLNPSYMPFFMREGKEEEEEERRLFYVASTRAIKQLILSVGSEKKSKFIETVNRALYSTAYSVDDIVSYLCPSLVSSKTKTSIYPTQDAPEEKYLEHAIFGRGKIISCVGKDKYLVSFVTKGEKVIDTSIAPVTFL